MIRPGLEDHSVGKLLGLPMGVDVCFTNHAEADGNSADNLLILLAAAGCHFVMGVPCADDLMLNDQSTSFHDAAGVRQLLGLDPAPEFRAWQEERGILRGRLAATEGPARRRPRGDPGLTGRGETHGRRVDDARPARCRRADRRGPGPDAGSRLRGPGRRVVPDRGPARSARGPRRGGRRRARRDGPGAGPGARVRRRLGPRRGRHPGVERPSTCSGPTWAAASTIGRPRPSTAARPGPTSRSLSATGCRRRWSRRCRRCCPSWRPGRPGGAGAAGGSSSSAGAGSGR